jgi:hypothetical protein
MSSYDGIYRGILLSNVIYHFVFKPFIRQQICIKRLAVTREGPSDSSEGQLNRDFRGLAVKSLVKT